jgi:formamidopyrimidine-DNA glycosylase
MSYKDFLFIYYYRMPEGPEIKYLSEICKKYIVGLDLYHIKSNSKTIITVPKRSKVIDVTTKGKLLILVCKDYYFHIHCGLTGWITFENPKYPRYEIEFRTEDNTKMILAYMDDSRRFSKLKIMNEKKHKKILDKMGIDVLSDNFTLDFFMEEIKKTSKKIVAFLMEQNKFCGIGNYIKNEALYLSHIDPHRTCNDLNDDEIKLLYNKIIFVLYSNTTELLKNNTELKPDKNFINKLKSIQLEIPYKFKVYQQEKDPMGHKVIKEEINGRKCFYVKEIQK